MKLKNILFLFSFLLLLASCGSSKKNFSRASTSGVEKIDPVKIRISENARKFEGTRYKYGGTSKRGMDCSGLIYTAFLEEGVSLPRTSRDMSKLGKRLNLREVKIGDLIFFETNKKKKVINHVGLVVDRKADDIFFIHSTSSRGVIVSSLNENYWRQNFVMARRVQ